MSQPIRSIPFAVKIKLAVKRTDCNDEWWNKKSHHVKALYVKLNNVLLYYILTKCYGCLTQSTFPSLKLPINLYKIISVPFGDRSENKVIEWTLMNNLSSCVNGMGSGKSVAIKWLSTPNGFPSYE